MILLMGASSVLVSAAETTVAQLIVAMQAKAKTFERSAGVQDGFQAFNSKFKLQPGTVSFSDYVVARLLYEATRDAGFWNLHWEITNRPPNSDNVWRQWRNVQSPSSLQPTAIAECDELSALFAFLGGRAGIRGLGLFYPTWNHTVAVWTLHQAAAVRVVIPTSQIFLDESDYWGTKKFDPWRQKVIYEYTRRDVPDSFEIPKLLFDFFLRQADKYGAASDATLQMLRYFREAVFLKGWTPEEAARETLKRRVGRSSSETRENLAALQSFAEDMHSEGTGH